MDESLCRDIDSVWLPILIDQEKIRSAMRYEPHPGDIFIASYPKCGTTWMQHIVCNILTRASPPSEDGSFDSITKFLDVTGGKFSEAMSTRGPIMSHLPPVGLRPVDTAKYIYVARNPYDVAVSYYHFLKGLTTKEITDVSFEKYLRLFLSGKVPYGDFFDHLLFWYERRNEPNVLFVTYEQLKADIRQHVLRIASFLGNEHIAALNADGELLQKILDACEISNMRRAVNCSHQDRIKKIEEMGQPTVHTHSPPPMTVEMHEGVGFVRKGVVGDWKNYFTPTLVEETKSWIAGKTQDSDVMSLWANCGLP